MPEKIESRADISRVLSAHRAGDVLCAGAEIGVFDTLKCGPSDARRIAKKLSLDARGAEILMNALAAVGLLLKRGEKFSLAPVAEKHLVSGAPEPMLGSVGHASNVRRAWTGLPLAVKSGMPVPKADASTGKSAEQRHRDFIMAMHDNSLESAERLAEIIGLGGVRDALNVGGGPGTYLFAMIRRNPKIKGAILDLPQTIKITREMIMNNRMQRSVGTIEGDFLSDDFGTGFDLVLMSSIIHINSPAENRKLIKKGFRALNPGGRLVIKDFMLDDSKTEPVDAALFSVNMLVNTENGASYTRREIRSWMEKAGFVKIRNVGFTPGAELLIGTKPKKKQRKERPARPGRKVAV